MKLRKIKRVISEEQIRLIISKYMWEYNDAITREAIIADMNELLDRHFSIKDITSPSEEDVDGMSFLLDNGKMVRRISINFTKESFYYS